MDIKASKIQINSTIRSAVIQDNAPVQYQVYDGVDMEDPGVLNSLVKDINKLSKEDHAEIYKALRKFKPSSFFATNSLGTHFNIMYLDLKTKGELYRIVQLSKENQLRAKVIAEAGGLHNGHISTLASRLDTGPAASEEITDINPTESEKLMRMKQMNVGKFH